MTSTQHTSQDGESWDIFCASRVEYLSALGEVIERGFTRRDTLHPAFCGCIDWHSSVHGAYALLTVARLTGYDRWAEVVDERLTKQCLDAECASLHKGDLDHELPYGYAWFLTLAIEREQGWGATDLVPLASEMASRLEKWIFSLSAGEVIRHFQLREYGNLSWALLNLWRWSQWKGNQVLVEKILEFTRMWFVLLDETLPVSYDNVTDEFFAASLQRTGAILSILPSDESQAWLTSFYKEKCCLEPIHQVSTPHSAGLNFSRAWAFWALFQSTQNLAFRDLYVNHIVTHIHLPEYWRDDYHKHAHWVPQFGIYAIALSMERDHV